MQPFLLISAIIASYVCIVQGQSSCKTPTGVNGNCVSLYDCEPLISIVSNLNRTDQDEELLRSSKCGYQGKTPKVCCPAAAENDNACFTPDAQLGQCINVNSCPHIASKLILAPNIPEEITNFVQNSRCEGPDHYSVCCGPPESFNQAPIETGVCTPSVAPPDPRSKCCGVDVSSANKIYGGSETAVDQYPWMVVIEHVKDSEIKLLCGGSLVSNKYVLTAGHCVVGPILSKGKPRNVRLSEYDTSNDVTKPDCMESGGGPDCTEGVTVIPIEKIIAHPDYNPNHKKHDIALLRLRSMAPYNDFIRPICLPTSDITVSSPNLNFTAAGWGATNYTNSKSNIKLQVDLPFVSRSSCQPAYSIIGRTAQLWEGQVCAGGEKDKDSCKGDSGGPLMYENMAEKRWELIGIVSFGPTPCGSEEVPGVYTKVHHYLPWIRSQIKP